LGGTDAPAIDAEVIEMVMTFFDRLELQGVQLDINSIGDRNCRPKYVELLRAKLLKVKDKLGPDSQRRIETNPLRVLDSKLESEQGIIATLPHIADHLCEECAAHYAAVKHQLEMRGVIYRENWRLVRGLDYYMRTTFEIVHGSLGAQNSVLGGGRYDGLAESLGSRVPAPGIGFSIGEDRLVMMLEQAALNEGAALKEDPLVMVTFTAGEVTRRAAGNAAAELRAQGIRVEVAEGKLKKVFEVANKLNARAALICGENETAAGEISMKDMESQVQVQIRRELLVEKVKECLSKYL